MAHHKHKNKRKKLRNAAPFAAPRALPRPRAPSRAAARPAEHAVDQTRENASVATKVGLAALGTGALCALIAREDWLPPTFVTTAAALTGAALAFAESPTVKATGLGVMAAGTGQLLEMLIDSHLEAKNADNDAKRDDDRPKGSSTTPATSPPVAATPAPATKRQLNPDSYGLPPGALEAAYQRARDRLAMQRAAEAGL